MRIAVTPDLHIEKFSGGTITESSSYGKNVVFEQYQDGRWYAMPRPGINKFEDASEEGVSDGKGRGVYYLDRISKKYFVNDDTIYEDSYSGSSGTITTGTERVYFFEVGDYLVICDPENNEGWYLTTGIGTLTQLTNGAHGFPTTFVNGGAVLNGKLYLMTPDADIVECDVEDPLTWNPLNFRNAEVESDKGVYLSKHHEHIVAFGTRSIEFFYDNANPSGSTLTPRQDVSYDTGCIDDHHVWVDSDRIFFIGQSETGGIGIYVLEGFQLKEISKTDVDTFIGSAILDDEIRVLGSGFQSGGRIYYILTLYNLVSGLVAPLTTLVYSVTKQWWGPWELSYPEIEEFPVVAWTQSTTTRSGEGILSNGDLVTVVDDFNASDSTGATAIYASGVYDAGVYSSTGASGNNIAIEVVTGPMDNGTRQRKTMAECFPIITPTTNANTLTVSWADNQNITFDQSGTVDTSDPAGNINRLGQYRTRNFKLNYQASDQIRIEGLEVT